MNTASRFLRRLVPVLLWFPITAFAVNLDDYLWKNRLLILVAPGISDPVVEQVRDKLESQTQELVDRDLLVIQLFRHGQSFIGDRPVPVGEAEQMRLQLDVDPDDKVLVLIGKDGGIKRRASLRTDLGEIFRQIDAMPMRQYEMGK